MHVFKLDRNGHLIVLRSTTEFVDKMEYNQKANAVEAIYELIGEECYHAANMGADLTLTNEQLKALKKIMEES